MKVTRRSNWLSFLLCIVLFAATVATIALADVKLLETGTDYDKLPDMWTIWILPYDPFGLNYMLYTVKNRVEENAVDEELLKLHSKVERLKSSKEVGVKYMHMAEVIKYQVEEEVEEIIKEILPKLKEEMKLPN